MVENSRQVVATQLVKDARHYQRVVGRAPPVALRLSHAPTHNENVRALNLTLAQLGGYSEKVPRIFLILVRKWMIINFKYSAWIS